MRRRVHSTKVIDLPPAPEPARPPSAIVHARLFIGIFVLIATAGMLLLMLPWVTRSGASTPPADAMFTAMSALAVTGLVTLDTATHWNWFGQAIILILIQIGGLGFMVGASLVLSLLVGGTGRLRHQRMIGENIPTLTLREAVIMARRIARFTFAVEAIGAVLLTLRFMGEHPFPTALWRGIFYSVSAFCNAGFDLEGNFESLILYRGAIYLNIALIILIQSGSLSYLALSDVADHRRWRSLSGYTKLVLSFNALFLAIGMAVFLFSEWNGAMGDTEPIHRPMQALFQSVSARTAGFATVDFSMANTFTDFVWVALMFVGGASGSTAGGVKLTTVAIILIAVASEVRGGSEPTAFHRRIPFPTVMRAITVVTLFVLIFFVMTLALVATERAYGQNPSFVAVLFEVMSAQATVGLSTGITPELSIPGKLILIVTMFVGRLGPLTMAYALAQRHQATRYRYAPMVVHIG